jgi:hypothetical protein
MKVIRYKPQPPKVPAWAQEALMKYCSKKPDFITDQFIEHDDDNYHYV